ncbi:MAG: hypothetical protein F4Z17_10770, partial [Acidimicrobiia bacterium]|nr:hypothetical protein [Acidimicrobiia bacterium]
DVYTTPGRGQSVGGEGRLRPEIEPIVPALQSVSLFGRRTGVMLMDAHLLQPDEAAVVTELLAYDTDGSRPVVLVTSGKLSPPLAAHVKKNAEVITVRKLADRDVAQWVRSAARRRGIRLGSDAAQALIERFGSDVGAIDQALDQLSITDGPLTDQMILDRFRNRPDQPLWKLTDALGRGAVDEAIRRMHDLLTHGHPLVLVATIENDLRRRALAAAAPDIATFAEWTGGKPGAYPTRKAWQAGRAMSREDLNRSVDAVRRADATLKGMPEETHLPTMERLVTALCYWYRG